MPQNMNQINVSSNNLDAKKKQDAIDEVIKKKGLRKGTIRQAISGIELGILRTMYRNYAKPVAEPEAIAVPARPVEPVMPLTPVMPIPPSYLQYLDEDTRDKELNSYRKAKREYDLAMRDNGARMAQYHQDKALYEMALISYRDELIDYEYRLTAYKAEKATYQDYVSRIKINKRIEKVYKEITGQDWFSDSFKTTYYILVGMPGHGKTTAFREASKKVAKMLEMRYEENPAIGTIIDDNTFVFTVVDLAGEVSKTSVSGIPAKESDGKNTYMTSLPPYRIATLQRAGGAVLLLDDLTNASEFIQNIALPLTNEGMFNEVNVKNVYVGATCNLGALDGTNTATMSTALRNRLKVLYVQDTLEDFLIRARETFNDGLGDAYVSTYFELNAGQFLSGLPSKEQMGGYTTPRSITNFIVEARKHIYDHGGIIVGEKGTAAIEKLESDAQAMLGLETGADYSTFLATMMSDADPIAKNLMLKGEFDLGSDSKFYEFYGSGLSLESKTFFHKFKAAVVNYAILAIRKGVKIQVVYERLVEGVMALDSKDLGTLLDYFNTHFPVAVPEYGMENNLTSTKKSLDESQMDVLVEVFAEHPDYDSDIVKIVASVLSRAKNSVGREASRVRGK